MKTKMMIIGMIAVGLFCVYTGTVQAAGARKTTITKVSSLVKKTFDTVGNAIWNNKGAIAVTTAVVAVTTQPEILAQPISAATTAVTTETSKAIYHSPIGMVSRVFFIAAVVITALVAVKVAYHYLKLWHIVPLLVVGLLICSCGVTEAAVQCVPTIQCVAIFRPFWDVLGVLLFFLTIFM